MLAAVVAEIAANPPNVDPTQQYRKKLKARLEKEDPNKNAAAPEQLQADAAEAHAAAGLLRACDVSPFEASYTSSMQDTLVQRRTLTT